MHVLKEQIDNYLSYCTHIRGFTVQTMQSKSYILKRFMSEIEKDNAKVITNHDFDNWREMMIKSGISPQTVNTRSHHVIAFFKYLLDYKVELLINLDIIHDIKHEQTEIGYYEKPVIELAKQHCNGMMDLLALSIAYESGMRLSELTNIKVEDISGTMIKVVGKGRKPRNTFVTPETAVMIVQWISRNEFSEGYIFPSVYSWDKPISPYHMRYTLGRPFLKAGIKDFHPHKLRHSFATTLVENGADVITVQNLLGHTNIATTSKYLHTSNKRLESEYQRLMKHKS